MVDVPNALPSPTLSSQENGVASTPTRVEQPTPDATSTPEPAVLAPDVAPPTPVAQPAAPTGASQPARLLVPDIGLDTAPVAVGLDERRIPIVPRHDVGWFSGGAAPGQSSNVVFWGHVLRWKDAPSIPAPFARVHELQPGAELIVVTADGTKHLYRVTQQIQVRPEDVQYIYPTTQERVTLVSCIGDNVILDGTLTKEFRLVTIAEPISRNQPASPDDAG
jgi:sortase (surface protein transpeptidase)